MHNRKYVVAEAAQVSLGESRDLVTRQQNKSFLLVGMIRHQIAT